MTSIYAVIVVSGQHDLPFDARAFPLTSFEMQCPSLPLIKGFRLFFPKCLLDPNNYKRFSFSSVNMTVSYDVLSRDNYRSSGFVFLITRFRLLVTAFSKGTTNEYT